MNPGYSFTDQLDIPLLLVILFFIFFIGLVLHLHQEGKREGYPLESDRINGRVKVIGFPAMPEPKTFLHHDGTVHYAPKIESEEERVLKIEPAYEFPGAPQIPTGDPLVDGVGPASYAMKQDIPQTQANGELLLMPLRNQPRYQLEESTPDLVGMAVVAGDGKRVGTVVDIWINPTEYFARFVELESTADGAGRRIMAPIAMSNIHEGRGEIHFASLNLDQFLRVPALANRDMITAREEDRINAYFAGGFLYNGRHLKGAFA